MRHKKTHNCTSCKNSSESAGQRAVGIITSGREHQSERAVGGDDNDSGTAQLDVHQLRGGGGLRRRRLPRVVVTGGGDGGGARQSEHVDRLRVDDGARSALPAALRRHLRLRGEYLVHPLDPRKGFADVTAHFCTQ